MVAGTLATAHAAARSEAESLAGTLADMPRRAVAHHALYRRSGHGLAFPLMAAHGALWGKRHIDRGLAVGALLSLRDVLDPALRAGRLAALRAFAEAFREINRRVFVEVWTAFALSAAHGEEAGVEAFVPPDILAHLNRCHRASKAGTRLDRAGRAAAYEAFFRWEQREIVAPAVDAAVAAFDWPLARGLALTPTVRFSYIPRDKALRFSDFASADERIEKGLRAYEIAEDVGLGWVEAELQGYGLLPEGYGWAPDAAFASMRDRTSGGGPGHGWDPRRDGPRARAT